MPRPEPEPKPKPERVVIQPTVAEEELQLSLFQIQEDPAISKEEQEVLAAITKLNVMGTTPMQAMTIF